MMCLIISLMLFSFSFGVMIGALLEHNSNDYNDDDWRPKW